MMEDILTNIVSGESTALSDAIQTCVKDASKIVTAYWPISSFIAANSLSGLENLPFAEAVGYGNKLLNSKGFLPLGEYHKFFAGGRINDKDLTAAISSNLNQSDSLLSLAFDTQSVSIEQLYKHWLCQQSRPNTKSDRWQIILARLQQLNISADIEGKMANNLSTLGDKYNARDGQSVTAVVNKRMIKWCAAFLDEGQAAWVMPGREKGFYNCWKDLAGADRSFRYYSKQSLSNKLKTLPDNAAEALGMLLQELEIPKVNWAEYLMAHLAQLPGWAGLIRWREEHTESEQKHFPITLVEYLAVRVFYEAVLIEAEGYWKQKTTWLWRKNHSKLAATSKFEKELADLVQRLVILTENLQLTPASVKTIDSEEFLRLLKLALHCDTAIQQQIWHDAYERHYRQELLQKLSTNHLNIPTLLPTTRPLAQAVFCIDVRSEGLRRQLEGSGFYQTYGIAGFFGVAMRYQPFGSTCTLALAPALMNPSRLVTEEPIAATPLNKIEQRLSFNGWRYMSSELLHSLRENLLTPFAFVEMVGLFSLFPLVGKTLAPTRWKEIQTAIKSKLTPALTTEPSLLRDIKNSEAAAEAAQAVGNMLRSIGLTTNFARLVLICGHGSETENNPYESALDCGACGGNRGAINATVAAALLNTQQIRQLLASQGLTIPDDTFFLAAEHNTTTDTVKILNDDELPSSHQADLERFKCDLEQAGRSNAQAKVRDLPDTIGITAAASAQLQQRASDWSQVRPEWGLARNAAFICGQRSLTAGLNLEGRVFLHSYVPSSDLDGTILEGILTAPVVVAEWINMQYYFSTVDNHKFGSSTKLLHTVVSQVGVMQGKQSDLLVGLPQQSVMVGDELYHEPLRLTVIVEASTLIISQIIAKHALLQNLTHNQWISVVAYNSATNTFYQYQPNREWAEVALDGEPTKKVA